MNITHQTVFGENGHPEAAIIPWSVFLEIQSLLNDGEATSEELEAMHEAAADRKAGNMDAFTDLEDLKAKAIEHKDNLAAIMVTYPSTSIWKSFR